jgi:hypothetical protein
MTGVTQNGQAERREPRRTRVDLLQRLPPGPGAELGVFRGDFSATVLEIVRPSKLYLVDLFAGLQCSGDANGANYESVDMADMESAVRQRFSGHPEVEVVKGVSWDWLRRQGPGSLAWAYLDTDHSYMTTVLELRAARQAVAEGGIIAGHDYHAELFPGVVRAVQEFAAALGLSVEVYDGDGFPSYAMVNRGGGARA